LTQVFLVLLYQQKVITAFLHDPGDNCFLTENSISGDNRPINVNLSSNLSASGIPPLSAGRGMTNQLFERCAKGRKDMLGLARGVFSSVQCF